MELGLQVDDSRSPYTDLAAAGTDIGALSDAPALTAGDQPENE